MFIDNGKISTNRVVTLHNINIYRLYICKDL